jgi:hypothetical protein
VTGLYVSLISDEMNASQPRYYRRPKRKKKKKDRSHVSRCDTIVSFVSNTSVHATLCSIVFTSIPIPYRSGTGFLPPSFLPSLSPSHASIAADKSKSAMYVRPHAELQTVEKTQKSLPLRANDSQKKAAKKQSNWVSKQRPPPSLLSSFLRQLTALYHVCAERGSRFLRHVKFESKSNPLKSSGISNHKLRFIMFFSS